MPGICPRCLREVYFAEEKLALGKVWHTFCFSCRNCRKLLDSCTVATHSGELFCRNCYNRLFSTTSVRPSLPAPISPIFPSVDNRHLVISPCESVSDCCCCCYRDKKCEIVEVSSQEGLLEGSSNCQSAKRRLRGGGGGGGGEEEELEADRPLELGGDVLFSETELSRLDPRSSQTTICDQPFSPTAVTAWYNRHHSASQSTISRSSSAPKIPLRSPSTPASGELVSIRNACNLRCSGNRRPGSPCRSNHKHREHTKHCHRHQCHEFQRSRLPDSHEQSKIAQECRGRNFVQNYRNNLRSLKSACSAMQNITNNVDVISFEHSPYRNDDDVDEVLNTDVENDEDFEDIDNCDEDARMRGGCGGGGGGSGCCCSGGKTNLDHSSQSSCGTRYQKERSSTIEGACGCSGRGRGGCGSSGNSGGCCSPDSGAASCRSPIRVGGCCGASCDPGNEGACASKGGHCLTGYENCPPRSADPCTTEPTPCGAVACSPPCSGRKGCCPPAGCRPVKRRIARCSTPCTGDSQSCGGGGCCGSGCRGGCGKPGQICLPLRPCTIPPCRPHPQGGGSPCMPPRRCAPQPPCCRVPVIPGTPGSGSGSCGGGGGGGGGCCRSGSPGNRTGGGGGCPPSTSCQQQEDCSPLGSCCQAKFPAGCECLGGGQDCQRCGRKVYQAEMQIASGVPYHNICFSCFCCRKPLETLTYHENCGEIYCKQCYVRNFGPQGYGYSGVLQTPM